MGTAMSDLETLIPQAVELVIDGEPLAIKPLKVGQMPAFLRAITPVMQQIGGDGIDWLALFGERGDDLLTAVSIAVGKPRGWVDALDADEAMFAGIVHELGRFYLLSRAADFPALLSDPALLAETINDLEPLATERVLQALNLPQSVLTAVRASRHFSGKMPPETLGDVLYVARAVSPRENPLDALDERVAASTEAAVAAIGLDEATVREVLAASGDEIYSIVVALEA